MELLTNRVHLKNCLNTEATRRAAFKHKQRCTRTCSTKKKSDSLTASRLLAYLHCLRKTKVIAEGLIKQTRQLIKKKMKGQEEEESVRRRNCQNNFNRTTQQLRGLTATTRIRIQTTDKSLVGTESVSSEVQLKWGWKTRAFVRNSAGHPRMDLSIRTDRVL